MRELLDLTDDEIRAAFNHRTGELIFTRDTLDDYLEARETWANPGTITTHTAERLVLQGARLAPGRPPQSVTVVDFGPIRGCLLA